MIFISIIIIFIAISQSIDNTFDLGLYEYIQYSFPLTEAEANYLLDKKTLYFTSDNNAPPFAYIDKTNRQYKGLVLDYVNALSIELEIDIEFLPQKWEDVITSVISGDADMCDAFPSEERMKYLLFSEPIYNLRAIVMTNKNLNNIVNSADLSGYKVAIPSGDYAIEYIKENIPDVRIIETSNLLDSLTALMGGQVDAVVGDEPVLLNFVNELDINDEVNILNSSLYDRDVCIGVNKSDALLISLLNKGILSLQKKNFVEKIQQKWFGISAPILKNKVPENFMLFIIVLNAILIIIFTGIGLWSYTLKIEVMKRTEELNKIRNNLQVTFDNLMNFLVCLDENGYIVNVNKSFRKFISKVDNIEGIYYKTVPIISHIVITKELNSLKELFFEGRYYLFSISTLKNSDFKYLILIDDITDKKLSQQQILQQNKMIALGQLAAGVAHEIRNPIGIIKNYCYILKTYVLSNDPVTEESIDAIELSVQRVDKIVNNLLDFSHNDTNTLSLINLNELIMNIISLENKASNKKDIEIIVNCSNDLKLFCRTESLNHIFLNLLSNSIDSINNYGKIIINCNKEEGFIRIDFIDNGTGISKENLELIYNPFFTTKKVGQGTGLGLYIVYNEIKKIGGEIQIDSHIGIGTKCTMKIPILKEVCDNV